VRALPRPSGLSCRRHVRASRSRPRAMGWHNTGSAPQPPRELVKLQELEPLCKALVDAIADARFDPAALARLYAVLESTRRELAVASDEVAARFHEAVGAQQAVLVEGVGLVEASWSANRTGWRNDDLWRELIRLADDERAIDTETGEIESQAEAALRVLSVCSRPSWRLSALKRRGIAVEDFCSTTWKPRIRIH
jgi:hypothetical protein